MIASIECARWHMSSFQGVTGMCSEGRHMVAVFKGVTTLYKVYEQHSGLQVSGVEVQGLEFGVSGP